MDYYLSFTIHLNIISYGSKIAGMKLMKRFYDNLKKVVNYADAFILFEHSNPKKLSNTCKDLWAACSSALAVLTM
jgi:hypothetical protein